MTGPGIAILLFGLLALGGGIIGYTSGGSLTSLIAGSSLGLALLISGLGVLRGKELGFVFAPLLTLSLTAFFAHRVLQSGDFIPFGLMGILGLVALALYCALPAKESS